MIIDPSWPVIGRTSNAVIHLAEAHVIVVAPEQGCIDDETTARQSVRFQQEHWKAAGDHGATIVLMDLVGHQTKEARRVYQAEVDPALITGFALVTNSVFGRAVASVFMGLARPVVPTRMFATIALALPWANARNTERNVG